MNPGAAWIDASALASLLLSSLIVMGSPGPATVSLTAVAAAFGLRPSLRYAAGVILGAIAVLAAVAAGAVAMLLSAPGLSTPLAVASALYMLYLAFRIAVAPPLKDNRAAAAPSFLGGFLLAIANPKAWLAIAAVFASATLSTQSRPLDAALKIAALATMIVVIHLGWLVAGASLSPALRDPVRSRIANIVFAALLVAATIIAWPV